MSLWNFLVGSSDTEVTQRTIYDEKNGVYEIVAGDEDYQAILGDREHTVLNEQPYEEKPSIWSRLLARK
jgi:hypothetical protein